MVLSLSKVDPCFADEHEALGIELLLAVPEALPLGRYVRPVLPGGVDDFFKGDLLLGEEAPNRAIAGVDMARGKLAPYAVKRQIGRRGDAGEQPVSLVFETRVAISAHRLGRDAPGLPKPPRPPDNAAHPRY